jgi:thiamine monophosphate kinase
VDLASLPLATSCRHALGPRAAAVAATAGEDYELLVVLPPGAARDLPRLRRRIRCRLTRIGTVVAGRPAVRVIGAAGQRRSLVRPGFDHFRRRGAGS